MGPDHNAMVQEQQEAAAPGAAQRLLSGLLSGYDRELAELPYGQAAGGVGAAPPAPPLPSGLPLDSRLFTNNANDAGLSYTFCLGCRCINMLKFPAQSASCART